MTHDYALELAYGASAAARASPLPRRPRDSRAPKDRTSPDLNHETLGSSAVADKPKVLPIVVSQTALGRLKVDGRHEWPHTWWHNDMPGGPTLVGRPSIARQHTGQLTVVCRDSNGAIQLTSEKEVNGDDWTDWGSAGASFNSDPTLAATKDGLYLFVRRAGRHTFGEPVHRARLDGLAEFRRTGARRRETRSSSQ